MLDRSGVHAIVAIALFAACTGPQRADRMGYEEARALFASRGVQPGQSLPALSLVTLDGAPADIRSLQRDRPLVLVTCSLTCNVARRQQTAVNALRQSWGDRVAVIMVYTIDAHPKGDPCPYAGEEWVPGDNERDQVLVGQPTTMAERLALAKQYAATWSKDTLLLVDTLDNASWKALGEAPNVGLCVSGDGIVLQRCGWFDSAEVQRALQPNGG